MQYSFDPFNYLGQANNDRKLAAQLAKAERDCKYYLLRKSGTNASRFVLKNQLEQYRSFGVDGRGYRDVYYVQVSYANS